MPISFWCVIAVWIWVYLCKGPVAMAMNRLGGYDNHHPRDQESRLTGWGARAMAAHENGFEAFAPFAAAVIAAHLFGAPVGLVNGLAVLFVVVRVIYAVLYIADQATLRSLVWSLGWMATLGLFLSPLF